MPSVYTPLTYLNCNQFKVKPIENIRIKSRKNMFGYLPNYRLLKKVYKKII